MRANEKSARPTGLYRRPDGSSDPGVDRRETFESLPSTAGPWSPEAQHGGPPAALLGRALERLPEAAGTRVAAAVGIATSAAHGERGLVARSSQALLVAPRAGVSR